MRWIRDHYAQSFRVEDVAQLSGMSVSAFYRNFQAVTAMSPIQFQKQIRLQEARLLLAARPTDVTGVGHLVGYDNPSQFSREYRRQFGAPPSQDAVSLRTSPPTPHRPGSEEQKRVVTRVMAQLLPIRMIHPPDVRLQWGDQTPIPRRATSAGVRCDTI